MCIRDSTVGIEVTIHEFTSTVQLRLSTMETSTAVEFDTSKRISGEITSENDPAMSSAEQESSDTAMSSTPASTLTTTQPASSTSVTNITTTTQSQPSNTTEPTTMTTTMPPSSNDTWCINSSWPTSVCQLSTTTCSSEPSMTTMVVPYDHWGSNTSLETTLASPVGLGTYAPHQSTPTTNITFNNHSYYPIDPKHVVVSITESGGSSSGKSVLVSVYASSTTTTQQRLLVLLSRVQDGGSTDPITVSVGISLLPQTTASKLDGALNCTTANTADADMRAAVSYTHLRAHETPEHLVCRLLLEKKKKKKIKSSQDYSVNINKKYRKNK
eukprot:TRINITY_DN5627_c0_g1_i1.p1 TRINITY_DN5627_c0_g1~~TRINITY_DN5627_c0_g1_i1.p1  ORF type:complete len:328 (+),score=77.63 TRINITY_DN5627_c0_g1_i1:188-1171(+)